MPTLGAPLDFAKLEARNMQAHQLGAAPSSPVKGQLYFNTGDNTLYYFNGTIWIAASAAAGGPPTGAAGGDLSGTYPNPQIAAGTIVDADVAVANKDGAAATPSLRTLGTGATQAAAGTDTRFSDARTPTGTAGGDLSGSYPNPQIAAATIVDADVAAANKDGTVGTPSLRTLGAGAQQAMPGNRTLDAITAPAADLGLNGKKITSLADPTANTDAATKYYVDNLAQGLDVKGSVRAASTANVATKSGPQTVDGVALTAGQRVLLKNQSGTEENGIWVVNAGAWTRATDLDTAGEAIGAFTFVEEGTVNADTGWVCTVDTGFALNINAMPWTQFAGAGEYTAGAGLTSTGKTFDVGAGTGISVAADTVGIANGGVNTGQIAAGAINLNTGAGLVSGTLAISNGGTGNTTTKAARESGLVASGYYSSATHSAGTTITITAATHLQRASRGLLVQVQDEATGNVLLPDVSVASNGDVTVTFAVSQSANTIRVTVIG